MTGTTRISRGGWGLLRTELRPRARALTRVAVWTTVEGLPALSSGYLMATALDSGFLAHRPWVGVGWLGVLGVAMLVQAAATRNIFPWLAEVVEPLRDGFVRRVVSGSLRRGVAGRDVPDSAAVARLTGQVESVRGLVATSLRAVRQTVVALALALVGLAVVAPIAGAIAAPLVLLSLVGYALSLRTLSARHRAVVLAGEELASVSGVVLTAIRDVVACGAEDRAAAAVGVAIQARARAAVALARASSMRILAISVGGEVPVVLVLALSPWLLASHQLSVGELVGAVTYLVATLQPALSSMLGMAGLWAGELGVTLHRLAEATAVPADASTGAGATPPSTSDLRVDGLTFAYGEHAEPVIRDLSFTLADGEHLAIVGPSGIGKSTLAQLLAGLERPRSGRVLLGDVPVGDIDETALRHVMMLIPQEAYVFSGTLRENLTYLRPEAAEGDLDRAVRCLGMDELVRRIGGHEQLLGAGGAELSSGERQLVALARVYLTEARIVILDEATCHLDVGSEARVEAAFAARPGSLIVIAHRISSARRADRILLLDGDEVHAGTHDDLVATSRTYADLVGYWDDRALTGEEVVAVAIGTD
ncbi:ABC transporter ATP-binding protein [Pseudonocardia sp. GCM10023141]|uniref:ABC transporter ATP-binding protein n=1 Tax=Pseudonocardia sp. GCM10023141 TaxID=3252653 RepID=UPI00361F74E7